MDPDISTEFSVSSSEEKEMIVNSTISVQVDKVHEENNSFKEEKSPSVSALALASNLCSGTNLIQVEETLSKGEDTVFNPSFSKADKSRKSAAHLNNPSVKRKVKVDWTPELHRQFVQAVEQLGVDKAVPSKILELMGIDCLTRHNIASHLQKYRSHRKHMLAREAEAATFSRRRQIYGSTVRTGKSNDVNSWNVPTTRFPAVTSAPNFRPLHVWGHPSADQALLYMWPTHINSSPSFPYYHHLQDVPVPGMPCFPQHFPPARFPSIPAPGLPPTYTHSVAPSIGVPIAPTGQIMPQSPFDYHQQSKESIDAVIGDVLTKPWLPLPLGLKPPSIDSVMLELQHQGVSKIPPSCA